VLAQSLYPNKGEEVKSIALFCVCIVAASAVYGVDEQKFSTYEEMRTHLVQLYSEQKYQEAAALLESVLDGFPNKLRQNTYNLALIYAHLEEYEKGITALTYAVDRGIWFGKYDFENEFWGPYKEFAAFNEILKQCETHRAEAQRIAEPEISVLTPDGYAKQESYPLFLALHGGGGNMADFKDVWKSPKLEKEFVVGYLQSSQVVSMDGFSWTEDIELTREEIADAYGKILDEYSVDPERIIIGGFSSGGVAAIDVALTNTVPVTGFIALCPAKPGCFDAKRVAEARKHGIRGTILTTEMDQRLPDQRAMADLMRAEGLQYQFVVTPNIGHWFPEDLETQIDQAIRHINYR
jgi:predicted esterase